MGSKKQSTASSTSNSYEDNRQVNDAGGGVIGTGNSQTVNNTYTDGGSFALLQHVADGVANSSAIQASMAGQIAQAGVSTVGQAVTLARDAQDRAMDFDTVAANRAFDLAGQAATNARGTNSDALGFARDLFTGALGMVKDVSGQAERQASTAATTAASAYQNASDSASGNRTVVLAGLGAIAVVGAAVAFKKG